MNLTVPRILTEHSTAPLGDRNQNFQHNLQLPEFVLSSNASKVVSRTLPLKLPQPLREGLVRDWVYAIQYVNQ
jgi:hypothetical protein